MALNNITRTSIVKPITRYRFKVVFHGMPELTIGIVAFKPDYFNKKITAIFREDELGSIKNNLNKFNKNMCPEIRFFACQPNNQDYYYTDVFFNCRMIGHQADYDYAANTPSEHTVLISFDSFITE